MKKILYFLSVIVLFASCEETITLDPEQSQPMVVIDALLTNKMTNHHVKITTSTGFYTSGQTPAVTDATVQITDDEGNAFDFVQEGDNSGFYLSQAQFAGIPGHTYKLVVNIAGEIYEAEETLMSVTPIDSLSFDVDEDERDFQSDNPNDVDDGDEGRFYDVFLYTKEPQETEDYYLFKFYRNGEFLNDEGTDLYYSDDEFLQEEINGVTFSEYYAVDEVAGIEMMSLTRNAFVFYSDLDITLNNDGGLFSPIPTNPRSNISNGALGLFQVSSVASAEITIQ